jgi:DNA helicase-2/ATP-dependent DNA helicase PcrA
MTTTEIPTLEGQAALAVDHRGSHIQIIASAGSGKTETVSQRVAKLVAEGVDCSKIVAFTFTEKAAAELKERIRARVAYFAGQAAADKLGTMYVGTIHGFCYQLLTRYIGKYEAYDVVDENQLGAFLQRQASFLNLKEFSSKSQLFDGISRFRRALEVVENEMLDLELLPEDLATTIKQFYQMLDDYRMLTFGQQISRAVNALSDSDLHAQVCADIEHLFVDEYQDVNPAQEELISRLSFPNGRAHLVVVGDDDQAIYQWRGSTVKNITTFRERYENVVTFELLENRRSRPEIVSVADKFASTIPNRLEKAMAASRLPNGPAIDIVADYDDEAQEADEIAVSIQRLANKGYSYSDMAILVRGKVAYGRILEAFETHGVPVQPGGRTGLFEQPDADFLGRCMAWLVDYQWKEGRWSQTPIIVTQESLLNMAKKIYLIPASDLPKLKATLDKAKSTVGQDTRNLSLVELVYSITDSLGVKNWDFSKPVFASRLGTIARFTKFVADYESMQKRSRVLPEEDGAQAGFADQGDWYFKNLATFMLNIALGSYDDFEGEEDLLSDSVALMTVHAAKGLEWPIVFLPSLTAKRFPSSQNGKLENWLIDRNLFDAVRYEGTLEDERRLFYVALTRAREWVSLSSHKRVKTQAVGVSPFVLEVSRALREEKDYPLDNAATVINQSDDELQITYSELAAFLECGYSYWLRNRIGFPPALIQEIGYGKAVHHLLRVIAEESKRTGKQLGPTDVDRILATDFFLPFAGKAVAARFREAAKGLVNKYLAEFGDDMKRVWQTERPFELALEGVVVSGRADVIIGEHEGGPDSLAIVDYKTSIDDREMGLQLQVYAAAGIREGLEIRGAFLHDLDKEERQPVSIATKDLEIAVKIVESASSKIKAREFEASPEKKRCGHCDVRAMCRKAAR